MRRTNLDFWPKSHELRHFPPLSTGPAVDVLGRIHFGMAANDSWESLRLKMPQATRIMIEVCQKCFGGDWHKMSDFARKYDPNVRDRGVRLGRQFREIIRTRNRSHFWNSVTKCDGPDSPEATIDGNSLLGLQAAIKRCEQGETVSIRVNGRVVGKLIPISSCGYQDRRTITNQREEDDRMPKSDEVGEILPITLHPSPSARFKQALLTTKRAWITTHFILGKPRVQMWQANSITEASNVIGNLRSRPEFRQGEWQRRGIKRVIVSIGKPTTVPDKDAEPAEDD
jgi:hypothetical protein